MTDCFADLGRHRRAAQAFPILSNARERELLAAAKQGDRAAVSGLIDAHMRLVVSIAARHARAGLSAHDLVAEGTVGLLEAIRHYELNHESRFATYAAYWVRAFVARYAASNRRIVGAPSTRGGRKAMANVRSAERALAQRLGRWPSRSELAEALDVDELEIQAVDNAGHDQSLSCEGAWEPCDELSCPEANVAEAELHALRQKQVNGALAMLNERERMVVSHQMAEDASSLSELARSLGVSRQRTGQIMANARAKLRGPLIQVA